MASSILTACSGFLAALPWRTAPRDSRTVAMLLGSAGLDSTTKLGAAVEAMLRQRVSECRDFFVLRGVRPRRPTVLQMAGRSLAADREEIARLDAIAPGMGFALLRAISQIIETWATTGALPLTETASTAGAETRTASKATMLVGAGELSLA